jgi:hypothetical protein
MLPAHLGVSKSFHKLKMHFFWPGMFHSLALFIKSCESCQKLKNPIGHLRIRPSTLPRPIPSRPWECVVSDVFHLPLSSSFNQWVLIFCCAYSKWIEATPLSTVNGHIVSEIFLKEIICRHGTPTYLLCDNASYYVHGQFPSICKNLGVSLKSVTAYHPQANGIAESKVKALKSLLRSLVKMNHDNWELYLPFAILAFNTSVIDSIGHSPFFINHGYEAVLPGPISMSLQHEKDLDEIPQPLNEYCSDLEDKLDFCYKLVKSHLQYNNSKHSSPEQMPVYFQPGDKVLLFHPVIPKGQHKTFSEFWKGPYLIVAKINPAVFKIQLCSDPSVTDIVYAARLKMFFS